VSPLRILAAFSAFLAASVYGVWIALWRRDRSRVAYDYARMLVRLIRPPLGLEVEALGREKLEGDGPRIYISNHQSLFDLVVLGEFYPPDTVVIGKKELRRIPFFGWLYQVTGNVLIDRKDNPSAVGRLVEAERAILERGVSVWIFPEGTRGKEPGKLLPFKKGAFYMAVATGAPLVPVVAGPVPPLLDLGRLRARPGTIQVRILDPIPTAGLSEDDVPALLDLAHERMEEVVRELGAVLSRRHSRERGNPG
jgi:1-acyl-sn-glycerol-3-phosphate acyltransferase